MHAVSAPFAGIVAAHWQTAAPQRAQLLLSASAANGAALPCPDDLVYPLHVTLRRRRASLKRGNTALALQARRRGVDSQAQRGDPRAASCEVRLGLRRLASL